jgi:hypothetical protein
VIFIYVHWRYGGWNTNIALKGIPKPSEMKNLKHPVLCPPATIVQFSTLTIKVERSGPSHLDGSRKP